ncbi:MAG: membrane protein insertion efficiency factor YidD [Spirochaetales bacterium]|nr:membrane protein insertion efficiency factor YidD [Candidatus Physcosoma equi]
MKLLQEVFLLPVHVYRAVFSPTKGGPCCRYSPSCSTYFVEAVRKHGVLKGGIMGFMRLGRCTNRYFGGLDPVPEKYEWGLIKGKYIALRKPKGFDKDNKASS